MALLDNMLNALRSLRMNKMRSLLTMLGIIIGVAAVNLISSIGDTLIFTMEDMFRKMGTYEISVMMFTELEASKAVREAPIPNKDKMTVKMVDELADYFGEEITYIGVEQLAVRGVARVEGRSADIELTGISADFGDMKNLEMLAGSRFDDGDIAQRRNQVILSDTIAQALFPGVSDPTGREILVRGEGRMYYFTVTGVYQSDGGEYFGSVSYIPLSTAQQMLGAGDGIEQFRVLAARTDNIPDMERRIEDFFERYYGRNKNFGIMAMGMTESINTTMGMLDAVKIAVTAVGAISLLVGGIGVMNIMLVSVTERTREIGIRKALGARGASIRLQFIVEAMTICLFGGLVGIILGVVPGVAISMLLGAGGNVSLPVVVISMLFSTVTGVFFGYYPASKAAKMDPIDALRYE